MEIIKTSKNGIITFEIGGKLSAATAEEFSIAVDAAIAESDKLILDFKGVSYLASAGLRVLVSTQKKLSSRGGEMTIINVADDVLEIFEVTGLDDVFNFQSTST
ncbi:anti-sigma-B factor antagonist [Spirochaetia bacterium]|nr:anti-sigma-B factor antagonist [Spirochaetia bacterium]